MTDSSIKPNLPDESVTPLWSCYLPFTTLIERLRKLKLISPFCLRSDNSLLIFFNEKHWRGLQRAF